MSGYRFVTFEETLVLISCLVIYLMLHFTGRAVLGSKGFAPCMPLIGLAAIYILLVIGSLLIFEFQTLILFFFFTLTTIVGVVRSKTQIKHDLGLLASSLLVATPMLMLATVSNEPLWDDMTHWLVGAQYIFREGHLPTSELPAINHVHPIYPWARAMLHAWANTVNSKFSINPGGIFNVMFFSSLFLWLPTWITLQKKERLGLNFLIALIAASSLLFIPWAALLGSTLVVSSYADPIFAVCLSHLFMCVVCKVNEKTFFGKKTNSIDLQIIVLIIASAALKQSGIYLSALLMIILVLVNTYNMYTYRVKNLIANIAKLGLLKFSYLIPALVLTAAWSHYAAENGFNKSFVPGTFSNFDVLPKILVSSFNEFKGRPYGPLGLLLLASYFIIPGLRNRFNSPPYHTIIFLAVGFFLSCYLFQITAYCIAFTKYEASKAASLSRYMAPAGLVVFIGLLLLLFKDFLNWSLKRQVFYTSLSWLTALVTIVGAGDKIVPAPRIDPNLEMIARSIQKSYPKGKTIHLLDMEGNGFSPTVVRFHLNGHMRAGYGTLYPNPTQKITWDKVSQWKKSADYLYVLNGPRYLYDMLGFHKNDWELATKLKNKYPQHSKLLLLDLAGDGQAARRLLMLLQESYEITIKTKNDFHSKENSLLEKWISDSDHVYELSSIDTSKN